MAKIALLIGVSEYLPEFPALPSAVKDVEAIKEVLGNSEMGGFDEINVLKNSHRQEIEEAIYELFADRNKDDVLLFYFSGHGVKSREGNLFLATPKTRKGQREIVTPTSVAASYLQAQMNNSFSQRLVVILDCCYSGAFIKGMTSKGDENIDIEAELGGKGRAILMSSNSIQSSFESEDSELSIYTKYLVEGIKTGAADTDNNGKISADELHQYVSAKVQEESSEMTPQLAPVKEGYRIYLARSPQDDPKLKYRREVQEILSKNNGSISSLNHIFLEELCRSLGLSNQEVEAIITEEMQPYSLFQNKLKRYEDALIIAVKESYPLTKNNRKTLQKFKSLLGLKDEDVELIEKRIISQSSELQSDTFVTSGVIKTKRQNDENKRTIHQSSKSKNNTLSNSKTKKLPPAVKENLRKAPTNSFKLRASFVAGIIGVGVVVIAIFKGVSYLLISEPYIDNTPNITTQKPINPDYSTLENLLKEKKWKEADQETYRVMRKVSNTEKETYVKITDFPCEELREINQLWVKHSNGMYGFSVQADIYRSLGGKINEYKPELLNKLAEKVGWQNVSVSDGNHCSYLSFKSAPKKGHLPAVGGECRWMSNEWIQSPQRCGL
ncbi:MAG: Clp protease [Okeania sp. SIO3B5]|uniref:caspase, EACC1-associated type n=1 Tax=Okeania sp. SIO3B5 TaxID=2607811 RepID=UPI0013FF3851|nr:GUN4 domain-containing protein [Okeania sp. SIO3B5]NEO56477.1 Clp protease [Okeania sp. SIO3B5]